MEVNLELLSKVIGNSVVFNSDKVSEMLNSNGVTVDAETYNTEQLIDAVVNGLSSSPAFAEMYLLTFFNSDLDFKNATSDYIQGGTALLGGIIGVFSSKNERDAAKAQANAQAQLANSQLEIARINQQTELAKLEGLKSVAPVTPAKSNTNLYIGLGIGGVVILGLVVFLAVKK
jgi:hypothetical protein